MKPIGEDQPWRPLRGASAGADAGVGGVPAAGAELGRGLDPGAAKAEGGGVVEQALDEKGAVAAWAAQGALGAARMMMD